MYSVSLNVMASTQDQRVEAFRTLTDVAVNIEGQYSSVVVSSHSFELEQDEDDIYYDEYTLLKVVHALREAGISDDQADAAINQMQNRGILFRERVR